MARIDPLPRADLHDHADAFAAIEAMQGYVPNSLFTMGRVPGLLSSFLGLARTVFVNDLIPPDLVQMIAHMSSAASGCRYCQAHTATASAAAGVDDAKLAAIWDFERDERFSDAERAALRLAFHAGQVPNAATDADVDECRRHFTDDQIAAIVAAVALFGFLNRWNDTVATDLEALPHRFADRVLGEAGWMPGKHVADE